MSSGCAICVAKMMAHLNFTNLLARGYQPQSKFERVAERDAEVAEDHSSTHDLLNALWSKHYCIYVQLSSGCNVKTIFSWQNLQNFAPILNKKVCNYPQLLKCTIKQKKLSEFACQLMRNWILTTKSVLERTALLRDIITRTLTFCPRLHFALHWTLKKKEEIFYD